MNQSQGILEIICGIPVGFNHRGDRRPSVRFATLGFGVERRWRKNKMFDSGDRSNGWAHLHPHNRDLDRDPDLDPSPFPQFLIPHS